MYYKWFLIGKGMLKILIQPIWITLQIRLLLRVNVLDLVLAVERTVLNDFYSSSGFHCPHISVINLRVISRSNGVYA